MSVKFRHIQVLSVALRNQIAAGEVVERPASAMKELIENSLDAEARKIDVTLVNGGRDLIRDQDDGHGIPEEELALAVTRHATSKISCQDDLSSITTMGFRGEALPSIASVSRFIIESACNGQAFSLDVPFGEMGEKKPSPLPRGTVITVRDLFGNIPARLKFLKNPATEFKRAQELFVRIALANLDVAFSLQNGDRTVLSFLRNESLETRLLAVWPKHTIEALRPFDSEIDGLHIHGLACSPTETQLRSNHILLYVNGRAIQDKRLLAAVKDAYKGSLISRDYPQILLFLEIDPQEVDVNVHPAKTEVRFQDESRVFTACRTAVQRAIASEFSVSKGVVADLGRTESSSEALLSKRASDFWSNIENPPVINTGKKVEEDEIHPFLFGEMLAKNPQKLHSPLQQEPLFNPAEKNIAEARPKEPFAETIPYENAAQSFFSADKESDVASLTHSLEEGSPQKLSSREEERRMGPYWYLGQIEKTYLLFRDEKDRLVILDQHAAHERVLYGRLLHGAFSGRGQLLLVPLTLTLHPSEQERLLDIRETLLSMGYSFSLSGVTLTITSVPPVLAMADAGELMRELLDGKYDDHTDMFKSMACKAAIKAGQTLTSDEVDGLLKQWLETEDRAFCPHGRPTVLSYDANALARIFKRK